MWFEKKKGEIPSPKDALVGREQPLKVPERHFVRKTPLQGPYPQNMKRAMFGMGCFWGVERICWQLEGVYTTAVGYAAGHTPNPTYEEVCSGRTGHNEVVLVVYDPEVITYEELLRVFWEGHNPTQGMRQGNDRGTQYRSGIYTFDAEQESAARASREIYQERLEQAGFGPVTTEIQPAGPFYFAEEYHQQYLAKNPRGYCGIGGTGVSCPVGLGAQ